MSIEPRAFPVGGSQRDCETKSFYVVCPNCVLLIMKESPLFSQSVGRGLMLCSQRSQPSGCWPSEMFRCRTSKRLIFDRKEMIFQISFWSAAAIRCRKKSSARKSTNGWPNGCTRDVQLGSV